MLKPFFNKVYIKFKAPFFYKVYFFNKVRVLFIEFCVLKRDFSTNILLWILKFWNFPKQLFIRILGNICFWSKYKIFKTSQNVIVYFLWKHTVYEKLDMIEFWTSLPQNQVWVDLLQMTDDQKVSKLDYIEAYITLSEKLVVISKV